MDTPYDSARYLIAKRTVDDRALNRHVVDVLKSELARSSEPLRMIEVGAGLGTMVARLVDWEIVRAAEYILLDIHQQNLRDARQWLGNWAAKTGRAVEEFNDAYRISGGTPTIDIAVRPICAELHDYLEREPTKPANDLLIANAFLDLVDVPALLPRLLSLVNPTALYWFTINFDGETIFEPAHALDSLIIGAYHRSMDERVRYGRPAGDSRTGRHLFGHLRTVGAHVTAAGSSDWVVHAVDGHYRDDEAYFLEHILNTIEEELNSRGDVDQPGVQDWLRTRRLQLAHCELVYIAHQMDFVGRLAQR